MYRAAAGSSSTTRIALEFIPLWVPTQRESDGKLGSSRRGRLRGEDPAPLLYQSPGQKQPEATSGWLRRVSGPEKIFLERGGKSGTVIANIDPQHAFLQPRRHPDLPGVSDGLRGVPDQEEKDISEKGRRKGNGRRRIHGRAGPAHSGMTPPDLFDHLLDGATEIGFDR